MRKLIISLLVAGLLATSTALPAFALHEGGVLATLPNGKEVCMEKAAAEAAGLAFLPNLICLIRG